MYPQPILEIYHHTDADIYENEMHFGWSWLSQDLIKMISPFLHHSISWVESRTPTYHSQKSFQRFKRAHWLPNGSEHFDSSNPSMQSLLKRLGYQWGTDVDHSQENTRVFGFSTSSIIRRTLVLVANPLGRSATLVNFDWE